MSRALKIFALALVVLTGCEYGPLRNIRVAGTTRRVEGLAPQIEKAKDGFVIRNPGRITADIVRDPDAFLCRLDPQPNQDVVQMSIGRVESLRCNALYNPYTDTGIVFDGANVVLNWRKNRYAVSADGPLTVRALPDVYKAGRGLKWHKPLDKSVFRRAPAGWCSWYIYYQNVTEEEVVRNTDWLAANLGKFGCEYVQIDDGWQTKGHGHGENRDWFVTYDKQFPKGMKWLAGYIKSKGLVPGIWLCPFGQSDARLFAEQPDLFVRRPDGTSIGEDPEAADPARRINWVGRYFIDPTGPAGQAYLKKLFAMLCPEWGYEYVKIDGQGGMQHVYGMWQKQLQNPQMPGDIAYRYGLAAIKDVMGPRRFLLNCGGGWASPGFCEGIRTGGDVGANWSGMQPAILCTMSHLYKNNIVWWTDPDVVCVRPPLTLEQARVWATLLGITGQLLMSSDKMYDLPEERVELLRRIYPVADIRPMDLYPIKGKARIFDLRISKPGVGDWDVVALFNWNATQSERISLSCAVLGLPPGRYIYYDVWAKKLVAVGDAPVQLLLAPMSCRVLAVRRQGETPQLVGVSRHLTQGADDLLEARWDAATGVWSGTSEVVGGDAYEIRFSLPPGWTAEGEGVAVEGPLAALTLRREKSGPVKWQARFRKAAAAPAPPSARDARLEGKGGTVTLTWSGANALAYRAYRNGELLGQLSETQLTDQPKPRKASFAYEVAAVGWDGAESARVKAGAFTPSALPPTTAKDVWLDEVAALSATQDHGRLEKRKSVDQNPLRVGGKTYERGLGSHANAEIVYSLKGGYKTFEAEVGVDDEKGGAGTVVFQVYVDEEKLFDSGVMKGKQPAKRVSVPLDGADELRLVVTDAGDGINCDHADWADARLIGNK